MAMTRNSTLFVIIGLALFLGFSSCKKFSGSQEVPAYIHIDSLTVDCDYFTYGANTSNITDAWVYVDDQPIGCFELPATFPILEKGPHKVTIYGGVCSNGIGDARGPYPFYQPKEYPALNLVEDSIITLNPVLNYFPINESFKIAWNEDFENTNSMLPTDQSDTALYRISRDEGAWMSTYSFYSGGVVLPPDSLDFVVATAEELTCHTDLLGTKACYLEMDYKTNDTVFVGIMYFEDYHLVQWPLVKVLPTDKEHAVPQEWKKIYINLATLLHVHESASYFKVYITSNLSVSDLYGQTPYTPLNETRYYYFDNLKVLYRL